LLEGRVSVNSNRIIRLAGISAIVLVLAMTRLPIFANSKVAVDSLPIGQLTSPFTLTCLASTRFVTRLPDYPADADLRPVRAQVTLSFDGKNLLYRAEDISTHQIMTSLYDGKKTYTISEAGAQFASIQPGFSFERMPYAPILGVGIPYFKLIKYAFPPEDLAEVSQAQSGYLGSEHKYIDPTLFQEPGQIRTMGDCWLSDHESKRARICQATVVSTIINGKKKALWFAQMNGNAPGFVWEFYDHRPFQGVWLASHSHLSYYVKPTSTLKTVLN
jgi:hypothetical protein